MFSSQIQEPSLCYLSLLVSMLGRLKSTANATIWSRTSEFPCTCFDSAAESSGKVMNLVQLTEQTECSTCTFDIDTMFIMEMPNALCAGVFDDNNNNTCYSLIGPRWELITVG